MTAFKDTEAARDRRDYRRLVRKASLTRAEKDILQCIVNLWFHHRSGREKVIRPGREKIAKSAKVSVITVARALAKFRDLGLMEPVSYAQGGASATRYTVDLFAIRDLAEPCWIAVLEGELQELHRPCCDAESVSFQVQQMASGPVSK